MTAQSAFAAGLEAAAKVADPLIDRGGLWVQRRKKIAAAIRAMKGAEAMTAHLSSIATPLANARAAFSSPDLMADEVLDTAALVLARSPYPDDQTIAREWRRRRAEEELDRAEWSDEGRDPRWPVGWWVAPVALIGIAVWLAVLIVIARLIGWLVG